MADDFYNLKRIYEDYTAGFNQSNYPTGVSYDDKNSYRTTASMSGPGNGPMTSSDGAPASGDIVEFPHMTSPEEILSAVEAVVDHEIDRASDEGMSYAVAALKRVQRLLLAAK